MKKGLLLFISTIVITSQIYAQEYADYKARAEENLKTLVKGDFVNQYFKITEKGIEIYATQMSSSSSPEFTLYYDEVDIFLNMFRDKSHFEMMQYYDNKGNKRLYKSEEMAMLRYFRWKPEQINGLKIALDPGHMASDMAFAIKERKFVRMEASKAGTNKDLEFFEADLAYKEALILKDTLESLGAIVLITRNNGESAVGKPFDQWLKEDYTKDLNFIQKNSIYSDQFINKLRTNSSPWEKFNYVYSYFDFVNRAWKINDFNPDLTLILHFNADEKGERYEKEGYWTPSENNYSMSFVPGSFLNNELRKKDARIQFLRLLVSPDLEESKRLAGHIMSNHKTSLGVEPYPWNEESEMLSNCIDTEIPGVFARNLYMTRAVESPLVYIEALYQDAISEAIRLDKNDFILKNGMKTSSRVAECAYTNLDAIKTWLEENKKLNDSTVEYIYVSSGESVKIANRDGK